MIIIRTVVNFALLLQDDFTGANLPEDGFQFWIDDRRIKPLKKPEGLYVFTGISGEVWKLTVAGAHYAYQTVEIKQNELNAQSPIVTLRMYRRGDLHFSDCEIICGKHKPGEMVFALRQDTTPLKLHSLEQPENLPSRLSLMGYTQHPLLRHRFCVGIGKNRELFVITAKEDDGSYLCDQHFRFRHKEGEPILRAYGTICDAQGRFFIPIETGTRDKIETVEGYREDVRRWGCLLQTAPN